jgi:hypothetical protein
MRTYEVDATTADDVSASLVAWQSWSQALPNHAYTQLSIGYGGYSVSRTLFFALNGTQEEADSLLASLQDLGANVRRMATWTPPGYSCPEDDMDWKGAYGCVWGCGLTSENTDGAYSRIAYAPLSRDTFRDISTSFDSVIPRGCRPTWSNLLIEPLGGAAGVDGSMDPRHDNAWPHREGLLSIQYNVYWADESTDTNREACRSWHKDLYSTGSDEISAYAYRNYEMPGLAGYEEKYYGQNYRRLQQIKTEYDPDNFFDHPQGIKLLNTPPTPSSPDDDDDGLSTASLVGIVVGAGVGVGLVAVVVSKAMRKQKQKTRTDVNEPLM